MFWPSLFIKFPAASRSIFHKSRKNSENINKDLTISKEMKFEIKQNFNYKAASSRASHHQPPYKSTNKQRNKVLRMSSKLHFVSIEELVQWNFYVRRRRHHWTEVWTTFAFLSPRETNCHCSLVTHPEAATASVRICSSQFFFSRQCPSPRISCYSSQLIVRSFHE